MLKRGFWGEDVMLYSFSCLFDLKITVLNSRSLEEYRYRHSLPLGQADVVLVYNGNNHYLYVGKYAGHLYLDKNTRWMYKLWTFMLYYVPCNC